MYRPLTLFLIALFGVGSLQAQLTNAEVYDFQPGDVFQRTFTGGFAGPHPVHLDTILTRTYSSGMDTLTYTYRHLDYLGPAFLGDTATFTYSVETLVIPDLQAPATHFTYSSCLPPVSSSDTSSCGVYYERLESTWDTSCLEPPVWHSHLYRGLGDPEYHVFDGSAGPNSDFGVSITYYNTSQHGECGNLSSFVGMAEKSIPSFDLYPNPGQNQLTISGNATRWNYTIYSLEGRTVQQGRAFARQKTINTSDLPRGVYVIEVMTDGKAIRQPWVRF